MTQQTIMTAYGPAPYFTRGQHVTGLYFGTPFSGTIAAMKSRISGQSYTVKLDAPITHDGYTRDFLGMVLPSQHASLHATQTCSDCTSLLSDAPIMLGGYALCAACADYYVTAPTYPVHGR